MKKIYLNQLIIQYLEKLCKTLENIVILLYVKKIVNYLINVLNQIMYNVLMN